MGIRARLLKNFRTFLPNVRIIHKMQVDEKSKMPNFEEFFS